MPSSLPWIFPAELGQKSTRAESEASPLGIKKPRWPMAMRGFFISR